MRTDTLPSPVSTQPVEHVRYARLWWVGLLAIVLSVVANLIVRAIALPFVTVPPEFVPLSSPVPAIVFTTAGVLAATLVFALVGRVARRPARVYSIVAAVVLVLSLIPNVMMLVDPASAPFPGGNVGSNTVLMLQHVVAAVVTVWVLVTQGIEKNPTA